MKFIENIGRSIGNLFFKKTEIVGEPETPEDTAEMIERRERVRAEVYAARDVILERLQAELPIGKCIFVAGVLTQVSGHYPEMPPNESCVRVMYCDKDGFQTLSLTEKQALGYVLHNFVPPNMRG